MDHYKIKDKIIDFVRNSPEDVNSRVATFIAGMQAQKSLTGCREKTEKYSLVGGNNISIAKTNTEKNQGE